MKKVLVMLLGLITFVVSCGDKAEGTAKDEKKVIGVTFYKYDDNFMASFRNDMVKLAEGNSNIELLLNDSQNSQATQNDQVDTMIAKGVSVLAINLVDPSAGQTVVDKAKAADIPIVLFNKDPGVAVLNSYDKAYYVGNNPEESGVMQGKLVEKHWTANPDYDLNKDGVIQYVLLKGEPGHPDAEARTKFAIDTLVADGFKVEKLHEDTAMWDAAQAKDKVDAWLSGPNGSKIEVILANNDGMAMGALEATKAHDVKLPIYGVDALPEVLKLISESEVNGTVLNDGYNQAKATLELASNLAAGKDPLEGTSWTLTDKAVRVPYAGVDMDNYKDFVR